MVEEDEVLRADDASVGARVLVQGTGTGTGTGPALLHKQRHGRGGAFLRLKTPDYVVQFKATPC